MISLDEKQLLGKPKKVGTLGGKPVMSFKTKGGLNLIATYKSAKPEILGVGPHAAIARHIAEKNAKDIIWSDLKKSSYIDPSHFQWLLPAYEKMTADFRRE